MLYAVRALLDVLLNGVDKGEEHEVGAVGVTPVVDMLPKLDITVQNFTVCLLSAIELCEKWLDEAKYYF